MMQTVISTVLAAVVAAVVTGTITYAKTTHAASKNIKEGVLSLLRLTIIQQYNFYMEQGYCSINDKEVVQKAYCAYHDLGGNGAITMYYNQIMSLPDRKEQ